MTLKQPFFKCARTCAGARLHLCGGQETILGVILGNSVHLLGQNVSH